MPSGWCTSSIPSPTSTTPRSSVRDLIWRFYRDLKVYRCDPHHPHKAALRARFDRIFKRKTGFDILDRLLARLHATSPNC